MGKPVICRVAGLSFSIPPVRGSESKKRLSQGLLVAVTKLKLFFSLCLRGKKNGIF